MTPHDERAVLLATASATLQCLGAEGEELGEDLHHMFGRVQEEHVRQLGRNRALLHLLGEA